jgi:hypothetical protein
VFDLVTKEFTQKQSQKNWVHNTDVKNQKELDLLDFRHENWIENPTFLGFSWSDLVGCSFTHKIQNLEKS